VFSQYGQDGIIQYLISCIPNIKETFVEFGVQSYAESSTRFLLHKWNWAGMIIDGTADHIANVQRLDLAWQHDLTCVQKFLTRENINEVISKRFSGEIGILSIDVDGVEYWLWEAIEVVSPQIVILEYNPSYIDVPVSVPYKVDHSWGKYDNTFLYNNASLAAYKHLARKKGYTFVGCDSSGTDSFFVKNSLADHVAARGDFVYRKSYWNTSPDLINKYGHLELVDVTTMKTITVREFFRAHPIKRIGKGD
jgi:hypothetical protein